MWVRASVDTDVRLLTDRPKSDAVVSTRLAGTPSCHVVTHYVQKHDLKATKKSVMPARTSAISQARASGCRWQWAPYRYSTTVL
jgi:hypothetical protein